MSYEPLHHKYRPQTFADLVGQEAIATTLTNALRTERIAPAYLFTGPRGTGKTSSARILAKSLNCKKQNKPTESPCGVCEVCTSIASGSALDVIEIDAASNTGVDNIREIIERAQFAPVQCRYKVYVIDEVHMLSNAAFNALLKTLEEPPKHVVFVLATTDPQRVLPTIISRCQRFDFRRIPLEAMVGHLQKIAAQENINITLDAVTLVAQVAQGGLRDAESLLDQLSLLAGEVTVDRVWDLVGAVPERDLMALTRAIASDNSEAVLDYCRRLMDRGREPLIVLQNLAGFYRDLLIAKTAPKRNDLVAVTPPTWDQLCEFANGIEVASILQGQQHLKSSEVQIKNTTQPRLWLEVTLLGLLPSANPLQLGETGLTSSRMASVQRSQAVGESVPPTLPRTSIPATSSVPTQAKEHSQQQPPSAVPDTSTTNALPTPNSVSPARTPVHHEQPEPTSAASDRTVGEVTHNEVDPQPVGLDQIWQQVLNHIKLFSTRELLRQHCSLLTFKDREARVGISSKGLLKLAQTKLPEVEAAFQVAYKFKVRVNLELLSEMASSTSVNSASDAPPQQDRSQTISLASQEPPAPQRTVEQTLNATATRSPANYSPTLTVQSVPSEIKEFRGRVDNRQTGSPSPRQSDSSISFSSTSGVVPEEVAVARLEAVSSAPLVRQDSTPSGESPSNASLYPSPVQDWDADEIEKALGNIKQFFEGEIVEFNDDFQMGEPTIQGVPEKQIWVESAETDPLPLSEIGDPETLQIEEPLADLEDDENLEDDEDDIPF